MSELIGKWTAAGLVSFKVKGRFLSSGKWGNFKFLLSDNEHVPTFKQPTSIHGLTCETYSLLREC